MDWDIDEQNSLTQLLKRMLFNEHTTIVLLKMQLQCKYMYFLQLSEVNPRIKGGGGGTGTGKPQHFTCL